MQSKKFFIEKICRLRGISPDCEAALTLYQFKIVELLIMIKNETPVIFCEECENTIDRLFVN